MVGTTAVQGRTQIKEHRALGHGSLDRSGMAAIANRDLLILATGYHAGRAVFLAEIFECLHRADLPLDAGDSDGIDGVVRVERLVLFAGMDLDGREASDPIIDAVRE